MRPEGESNAKLNCVSTVTLLIRGTSLNQAVRSEAHRIERGARQPAKTALRAAILKSCRAKGKIDNIKQMKDIGQEYANADKKSNKNWTVQTE